MRILRKIKDIYIKVHYWGFKGVIDYFRGFIPDRIHRYRLRHCFLRNARKFPMKPITGITIIADFTARGSLNKVIRDLAFSLQDAKIPYQTFNTAMTDDIPLQDVAGILTPKSEFRLLRYTHIITLMVNPLPSELNLRPHALFFWEFSTGVLRGYPDILNSTSIIGMSDFNVECFSKAVPPTIPVYKILYPFRFIDVPDCAVADVRSRYGLSEKDFVVFYNFDFRSSCNRKNPQAVLRAFRQAFRGIEKAKLLFKTKGAQEYPAKLAELMSLAESLGISDQFICVNDYIPQRDVYGLTAACDVYVSLHRGEGFGLGIAEAMSLGKPVVVTDYSATTEFCNVENSIPVPYKLVRPAMDLIDHAYYVDVQEWAEPDVVFAGKAIHRLYENPALRRELGRKAKESIHNQFSMTAFRESIEAFLAN